MKEDKLVGIIARGIINCPLLLRVSAFLLMRFQILGERLQTGERDGGRD